VAIIFNKWQFKRQLKQLELESLKCEEAGNSVAYAMQATIKIESNDSDLITIIDNVNKLRRALLTYNDCEHYNSATLNRYNIKLDSNGYFVIKLLDH